jgi:cyanate permease
VFVLALTHVLILPVAGSWRGALVFYGICAALVTVLWTAFGRDSPQSISDRGVATAATQRASYWQLILQPAVLVVVLVGFSGFLSNHGVRNWLPQILEAGGMDPSYAGLMGALPALTGMIGSIVILRLASMRAGNRKPVTLALLVLTGVSIAAIMFTEGWLLVATIAVEGFCAAALIPLMLNALMETPSVGAKNMGAAGGLFFAVGEVGGTLGPVVLGLTADMTGSFMSGMLMLAAVMWIMLLPALRIRV